jgi:hypothetical protein
MTNDKIKAIITKKKLVSVFGVKELIQLFYYLLITR